MNFTANTTVKAPPDAVWALLIDPQQLAACIPGVEEVTQVDERTFDGVVSATIGPMSGKFALRATIVESDPPRALTTHVHGTDSVTKSTMDAEVVMTLASDSGAQTELTYQTTVDIKGRLAILGDMVLRATASLMLDEFGQRLQRRFEEA